MVFSTGVSMNTVHVGGQKHHLKSTGAWPLLTTLAIHSALELVLVCMRSFHVICSGVDDDWLS